MPKFNRQEPLTTTTVALPEGQKVLKLLIRGRDDDRYRMRLILSDQSHPSAQRLSNLRSIPGVEILSIMEKNTSGDCARYVFHERQGEPWALAPTKEDDKEFFHHTRSFLLNHGYRLVSDVPRPGDIAAYGDNLLSGTAQEPEKFQHFGIVVHDPRMESHIAVESKIAGTPEEAAAGIIRHPIKLNHLGYGDEVIFFRKEEKDTNSAA